VQRGCNGGFQEFERAEQTLHRLEQTDAPAEQIASARAEVDALKPKIAADQALLDELDEVLTFYKSTGFAEKESLAEYLRKRKGIEDLLRRDPLAGMFEMCGLVGIDPLAVMLSARDSSAPVVT
jgi:hypothetical protein